MMTKIWSLCVTAVMLVTCSYTCVAKHTEEGTYPDFRRCFDILTTNRKTYNNYNDSIFIIDKHNEWVDFFYRRAAKNHEIFDSNKDVLHTIEQYFGQDHRLISTEAYLEFKDCAETYILSTNSDPFLNLKFCQILENYSKYVPDSLKYTNMAYILQGVAYSAIYNLGHDKKTLEKSYYCFNRVLDTHNEKYPDYQRSRIYALWNLSMSNWMVYHMQTVDENRRIFSELVKTIDSTDVSGIIFKDDLSAIKRLRRNYEELLVRNVYMVDSTAMDKQEAETLMRKIIKRNMAVKNLDLNNYQRTLLMQNKLGEITIDQAWDSLIVRYLAERKELKSINKITDKQLSQFIYPCFTLLYLNDLSDKTYAQKRRFVIQLCHDIETAYQNRADGQYRIHYVKLLNQLTTYPRLIKYLTEDERIHFLNALNVATQVTTYAHSVHVSMIAREVMKAILKYQPQLLTGTLGQTQVANIRAHKKKYLDYIHAAAMYHDLGKNSIITVVSNDYRPLTDEEFSIIKQHPALGTEYLELGPSLAKYHDTTLGHHKWYNGKGGYPDNFDNTKSPMRIMIDIVTLSDCMQAATEHIGRNYKGEKNFDTVMKELRRDAGVRYNPQLVELIDAHPDVAKKLAELINEGWVDIYYNIYRQFINK